MNSSPWCNEWHKWCQLNSLKCVYVGKGVWINLHGRCFEWLNLIFGSGSLFHLWEDCREFLACCDLWAVKEFLTLLCQGKVSMCNGSRCWLALLLMATVMWNLVLACLASTAGKGGHSYMVESQSSGLGMLFLDWNPQFWGACTNLVWSHFSELNKTYLWLKLPLEVPVHFWSLRGIQQAVPWVICISFKCLRFNVIDILSFKTSW